MIKITIYIHSNKILEQVELLLKIIPKIYKILYTKTSKLIGRQGGIIADSQTDEIFADFSVEKKVKTKSKEDIKYCHVCDEAAEYLSSNKLNSICSGSILHKQMLSNCEIDKKLKK